MKFLMTGAMSVGLAGIAMLATATGASALSFSYSNNTPATITDFSTVSRDIMITDTANVTDLTVTINGFNHTWLADLIGSLTHVDTATTVNLFNRIGGSADLNGNYSFNSSFTNNLATSSVSGVIPSGNYFPTSSFALFNGQSLNGTWRLTVSDNAGADVGGFSGWTLSGQNNATTTAVPVPPQVLGTALLAGLTAVKKARSRKAAAIA
jgi:subtilisin-like proprotein convertase family protein